MATYTITANNYTDASTGFEARCENAAAGDIIEFDDADGTVFGTGLGKITISGMRGTVEQPITIRPATGATIIIRHDGLTPPPTTFVKKAPGNSAIPNERPWQFTNCWGVVIENFNASHGGSVIEDGVAFTGNASDWNAVIGGNNSTTGPGFREHAPEALEQALEDANVVSCRDCIVRFCDIKYRGITSFVTMRNLYHDNEITELLPFNGGGIRNVNSFNTTGRFNTISSDGTTTTDQTSDGHDFCEAIRNGGSIYGLFEQNNVSNMQGLCRGLTCDAGTAWIVFQNNNVNMGGGNDALSVQKTVWNVTYQFNVASGANLTSRRPALNVSGNLQIDGLDKMTNSSTFKCNNLLTNNLCQLKFGGCRNSVFEGNRFTEIGFEIGSGSASNPEMYRDFLTLGNIFKLRVGDPPGGIPDGTFSGTYAGSQRYVTTEGDPGPCTISEPAQGVPVSAFFETGDTSEFDEVVQAETGAVSVITDPVYAGTYAVQLAQGANQANVLKWTVRENENYNAWMFPVKTESLSLPASTRTVLEFKTGATSLAKLQILTTGVLRILLTKDDTNDLQGDDSQSIVIPTLGGWVTFLVEVSRASNATAGDGFMKVTIIEPFVQTILSITGCDNFDRWTNNDDKEAWFGNWS